MRSMIFKHCNADGAVKKTVQSTRYMIPSLAYTKAGMQ